MELSGINASAYTDYLQQQTSNALGDKLKSTLTSAAENAKKAGGASGEDGEVNKELMDACNQFEAYFLEQIFKEMQKSVDALKSDESNSNKQLVDYFKDQTLQDMTMKSTQTQGLGLAQMLYENMKHNVGMSADQIKAHNDAIVAEAEAENTGEETAQDGTGE